MEQKITLNIDNVTNCISEKDIEKVNEKVRSAHKLLVERKGPGKKYLGWLDLPYQNLDEIPQFFEIVQDARESAEVIICIGIGGSYLGAKSVIEALSPHFNDKKLNGPKIIFAGHHIDGQYLTELVESVKGRQCWLNVISKSGTTTEPGIAFRVLRSMMEEKYDSAEIGRRIVAVTDKSKGAMRKLAENENYRTFAIPDDVGGRFSVFTPVGLFPIAAAGFDVRALIDGAKDMADSLQSESSFENIANLYAGIRFLLYSRGKTIEILSNFNPKLVYFSEWWKQLFGESEGKDQKGIFPTSANFTTDLHSLGQYIQEGLRNIFETFLIVSKAKSDINVPEDSENLDGLNYLAGKSFSHINYQAYRGTSQAHSDGGVPNMTIAIPEINEYWLGQLIYFFEHAVAVSGYLLGINPFDQPGVEAYKNNMFRLLGKPGF